jgi:predicted acyltransferase
MNVSKKLAAILAVALCATIFTHQPVKAQDPVQIGIIGVGALAAWYGLDMLSRYKYDTKDRIITNTAGVALLGGGIATIFMSKQIASDPEAVARLFYARASQICKNIKKSLIG